MATPKSSYERRQLGSEKPDPKPRERPRPNLVAGRREIAFNSTDRSFYDNIYDTNGRHRSAEADGRPTPRDECRPRRGAKIVFPSYDSFAISDMIQMMDADGSNRREDADCVQGGCNEPVVSPGGIGLT